jgi:hypothetical protein
MAKKPTVKLGNKIVADTIASGKLLAKADAATATPYLDFMGKCIITVYNREDTGVDSKDAFDMLINAAGLPQQRRSDMWTIAQCGMLTCAPSLVKRFNEVKPSRSGLLFAAQSVRGTGWFKEGGDLESKRVKVAAKSEDAPPAAKIKAAVDAAMHRTNNPPDSKPATLKDVVEAQRKALKRWVMDGFTRNGKKVKPANDPHLIEAIKQMSIYLSPANVKSLPAKQLEARIAKMMAAKDAA